MEDVCGEVTVRDVGEYLTALRSTVVLRCVRCITSDLEVLQRYGTLSTALVRTPTELPRTMDTVFSIYYGSRCAYILLIKTSPTKLLLLRIVRGRRDDGSGRGALERAPTALQGTKSTSGDKKLEVRFRLVCSSQRNPQSLCACAEEGMGGCRRGSGV